MFYSRTTGGFYVTEIHGENIPQDAVEITQKLYVELLEAQAAGKQIASDIHGRPILLDPVDIRDYKQKREAEYPPFADYLDGIVKGDQTQVDAYIDACLAVKTKYPKPDQGGV